MTTQATVDEDAYDPFEALNHALGADRVRDPYPKFAEMRRQGPVYKGGVWKLLDLPDLGTPEAGPTYQDFPIYTAVSYDAVTQVLRSPGVPFSSSAYAHTMGPVMGHSILEMDEPEHAKYRTLLEGVFSKRAMEQWEVEVISPTIHHFIDRFADRGNADLVREFTFPFPVHVITGLLGLPEEDLPQFHRWSAELIGVGADPARGIAASQKLRGYLIGVIDQRRKE